MRENSIVVACDAGIPVVLAATRRAAQQLERLAEDLLVAGAELEILSGIERAPGRLAETLDRLDRPAVVALCFTAEDLELDLVRTMIAEHGGAGHLRIEYEIGCGGSGLHPVVAAMRELERRNSDAAIPAIAEIVAQRGEHVSDAILVPPLLPVVAARETLARPRRRGAWAWALGTAASASAAAICFVALEPAPAAPMARSSDGDAFALVTPKPAPAAPEPRISAPSPATPLPSVHVAAQGPIASPAPIVALDPSVPPSAPPTETASGETELDVAIHHRKAIVDHGVVAHRVEGDRDWYAAMTTCRARGFWRTGGWRVPSVAELRSLARTRAFTDAVVWSTRRGAEDPETAVTVTMRAGTTTTTDKRSTTIATICVKDRG